jgi:protein-tyrosine phosphatase
MAEGILRHLSKEANLDWELDSAGTGAWHIGEQPDRRAINSCAKRGIDITGLRARQVHRSDFDRFDLILSMDESNHSYLLSMARNAEDRQKVKSIMSLAGNKKGVVPDPYFNGRFDEVFELLYDVCSRIVSNERI